MIYTTAFQPKVLLFRSQHANDLSVPSKVSIRAEVVGAVFVTIWERPIRCCSRDLLVAQVNVLAIQICMFAAMGHLICVCTGDKWLPHWLDPFQILGLFEQEKIEAARDYSDIYILNQRKVLTWTALMLEWWCMRLRADLPDDPAKIL